MTEEVIIRPGPAGPPSIVLDGTEWVVLSRHQFDRLMAAAEVIWIAPDPTEEEACCASPQGRQLVPERVRDAILRGHSRLRAWRDYYQLSRETVAHLAGVGERHLARLENRRAIADDATLMALARVLEVPPVCLRDP